MTDTTTTTPADRLEAARAELRNAELAWYDSLPPFPADGRCECGADPTESAAFTISETGYERWTSAEWAGDHLHAFTDGWDDMSDDGRLEWVECDPYRGSTGCGRAYRLPDGVEYD